MDHNPYIRKTDGANGAVLLIHGIVGTPRQFDPLLDLIPEDWSIYNLLLDGHGGSVQDFSHTCMEKWKQQVEKMLEQCCRAHEKVVVVGHSMGTLLAMEASKDRPRVKTLFLLNVPLHPRLKLSMAVRSVGLALGLLNREDPLYAATSISPDWRLWRYLGWIPRYLELFKLCAKSRKEISKLTIPVWAVQSAKDELVSSRTDRYLQDNPVIRYAVMENSGHFAYAAEDLQMLRKMLAECIAAIEKPVAFWEKMV